MAQWTNEDGLNIRYGTEQAAPAVPTVAKVLSFGNKRQVVIDFTYDNLPGETVDANNDGTNDAFSDWDVAIPAHAYITESVLQVTTAFTATGTSPGLNIGLYQKDATVIDADGIDAAVAVTALSDNAVVKNDGALVAGTANVGDNDAYLKITLSGTDPVLTAGAARIVIEYVVPAE